MRNAGVLARLAAVGAILAAGAGARPAAAAWDLVLGADQATGRFLGDDSSSLQQVYIQPEFGSGTSRLVLRIPYVRLDHTGFVTFAPDAPIVLGSGTEITGRPPWQTKVAGGDSAAGTGDILAQYQTYLLRAGKGVRPAVVFDLNFKWGRADESKGLGTGRNDYGAGLEYVQPFGKSFQILGGATYWKMGSPENADFKDRTRLMVGFAVIAAHTAWRLVGENVTPALSEVPRFDVTGAVIGSTAVADYRVVRGEVSLRNTNGGSTRLFLQKGLNDSSPGLAFGLSVATRPQ